MNSIFDRNKVIADLRAMKPLNTAVISDGKGHSVRVSTGSGRELLYVYASRPDMCPKSLGEMADLICESSQSN